MVVTDGKLKARSELMGSRRFWGAASQAPGFLARRPAVPGPARVNNPGCRGRRVCEAGRAGVRRLGCDGSRLWWTAGHTGMWLPVHRDRRPGSRTAVRSRGRPCRATPASVHTTRNRLVARRAKRQRRPRSRPDAPAGRCLRACAVLAWRLPISSGSFLARFARECPARTDRKPTPGRGGLRRDARYAHRGGPRAGPCTQPAMTGLDMCIRCADGPADLA